MRISDIGEFPLIDRLDKLISTDHPDVIVGIGDDVAVLAGDDNSYRLATIDAQVETIHFIREVISPYDLGRRALAINLSDIAAMGGTPQFALVALALPNDTEVDWIETVYRGIRTEADRYDVVVVGGNMARAPEHVMIDICVLGNVKQEHLLLRAGAQPGDKVLVTGQLGDASAGLWLVQEPALDVTESQREQLFSRLSTPTPRLPESAAIARTCLATAMLDLSDGLSSDIGHICDRSGVGVRIWANTLPISDATRHIGEQTGEQVWDLALAGGEDFELCFTVPDASIDTVTQAVEQATGTPVTVVGEVLPAEKGRRLVLPDGEEIPLEAAGWQHFRRENSPVD